jgi:two-component sensor histidine kinase
LYTGVSTQPTKPTRPYPDAIKAFTGRLQALSTATDVITRTDRSNGNVQRVVEEVVGPYRDEAEDRFVLAGSDVTAPSKVVIGIGMAVHELCTNSLKYGALSGATGKVSLSWAKNDGWLDMEWRETGGPPVIVSPTAGFGTRLLRKGIFEGAAGSVDLQFLATGVLCRIRARIGGTER